MSDIPQQNFQRVKSEAATAQPDGQHTRQGWFIYFWNEAVGRAGSSSAAIWPIHPPMSETEMKERKDKRAHFETGATKAQSTLIDIWDKQLGAGNASQKFARINTMDAAQLRQILTTLLRIGCRGVPLLPDAKMKANPNADNILHYCRSYDEGSKAVEVGWRSEKRTWEKIQEQHGTKRQVDVEERATAFNMRKTWHPFSQPEISKYMWCRAGANMDACFYSVISTGLDFQTVVSFPLLDPKEYPDLPNRGDSVLAVCEWSYQQMQGHSQFIVKVRTNRGQERYLIATTVYVYMFILKGLVVDTKQVGAYYGRAAFPERGVQRINLDDIYGCYEVLRVHHEDLGLPRPYLSGKNAGQTVFIKRPQYTFNEDQMQERYLPQARTELDKAFGDIWGTGDFYPQPAFSNRWTETGQEDMILQITELLEVGVVPPAQYALGPIPPPQPRQAVPRRQLDPSRLKFNQGNVA